MENIQRYFFIVKIVLYSKKIDVILSLNQLEHKSDDKLWQTHKPNEGGVKLAAHSTLQTAGVPQCAVWEPKG